MRDAVRGKGEGEGDRTVTVTVTQVTVTPVTVTLVTVRSAKLPFEVPLLPTIPNTPNKHHG